MTKTLLRIASLSACLLVGLLSAGPAQADVSTSRQAELTHLLKQDCGSCHGMTLKGGLGPALLPQQLEGKDTDYLVMTILEGHPDTAMPGWKTMLSADDALWIAEQLKQGVSR